MTAIFSPKYAPFWFVAVFGTMYLAVPAIVEATTLRHPYFPELMGMTALACAGILAGYFLPLLDRQFGPKAWRITVPESWFQIGLWGTFVVVLVVTLATAPSIPLLSAFINDSANLDVERAQFLKMRTGWEAALPYIHTLLTGALLPMALASLFLQKAPGRIWALQLMLLYSPLFLVKAQIIHTGVPLLYVAWVRRSIRLAVGATVAILFTILLTSALTGVGAPSPAATPAVPKPAVASPQAPSTSKTTPTTPKATVIEVPMTKIDPVRGSQETSYFGSLYPAKGTLDFIAWRTFAVPIFTAADALYVVHNRYNAEPLMGSTSSFIAALTGRPRVALEADTYAHQWGASEYGRSNATFMVEAFANFGWLGVALFALFIGQSLRWLALSEHEGAKAVWPLYAILLYSGSLIPVLLSNGYLLFFAIVLFVRFEPMKKIINQRVD